MVVRSKQRYLTSEEACEELSIRPETLYAYVSRGLIRSEAVSGDKRARRYRAEDIRRLKERREARRDPARITENALYWGAPVLDSAITLIADGRLYYRGRDALDIARNETTEGFAVWLWSDGDADQDAAALFRETPAALSARAAAAADTLGDLTPVEAYHVLLPLEAVEDFGAYDLRPGSMIQTGARILRLMATIAAREEDDLPVATKLQRAWVPGDEGAAALLNKALILCADHELNVASFTARCVASAGAPLYAVVIGGLSALQGTRHGGHSEHVEAFLDEMIRAGNIRRAISSRLKAGERVPGFGHRLYPDGDPRARALIEATEAAYPDAPEVAMVRQVVDEIHAAIGLHPALDFGLAALSRVLGLPDGGSLSLFAMGRTIGWVAHAIEQVQIDRMIRPRARYVGEQPDTP